MPLKIEAKQSRVNDRIRSSNTKKDTVSIFSKEIELGADWPLKHKAYFFSELAAMLRSGLDVHAGLDLVARGLPKRQQQYLENAQNAFIRGESLSASLKFGKMKRLDLALTQVGETTGRMAEVFASLADHYNRQKRYRSQLLKSLSYPAFVLTFSMGILYFLLAVLVPMFADTYDRFGGELPKLTQWVQMASDWAMTYVPYIVLLIALASAIVYWKKEVPVVKQWLDYLVVRVPLFGKISELLELGQTCRTLSVLLESGITLEKALTLSAEGAGLTHVAEGLLVTRGSLIAGAALADSLPEKLFDLRAETFLRMGESTGTLSTAFQTLAEGYDSQAETRSALVGSLMEPVLILVLGGIVGLVLVAMYLPLFSLGTLG